MSKTKLNFTRLEDRVTPANVLANLPENNQSTLTSFFTQSETGSVAFGNTIVVAYNDSGSNSGGNRFTGYARSTDGGATFTDLGALTASNNDAGDPVLARDEVSGRIYLATLGFTTSGIQVFRSNDNGLTFGAGVTAFTQAGASMDKEWITVDNFAGAGQGNVYLIGRDFGSSAGVVFTRSIDGGSTWSTPITIVSGNQGAFVTVNADHSVSVFWLQTGSPQTIRTRRSTDGGLTFGATTTVASLLTTGVNGDMGLTRTAAGGGSFRSNAFPSVVSNPTQPGVIYVAYADNPAGTDKADVFFTQSNNYGATWSTPIVVNTDGTGRDQWQPAIRITPNGQRLSVSWYDRRLDSNNSLIDYFARTAAISGTTTTFAAADTRISDTSFAPDFGRDNVINSVYMGDYDQGSATNGRFIYVWADNRLGGPDIRVSAVPIVGGGPTVFSYTPTGITTTPTPIEITFDQAMDPTSFSVADDVLFFTRDGTDIKGTITGFSWLNGNTTLRINHTSVFPGAYALRLGVNILSSPAGLPMDNDFDGTPGEIPDDEFQVNFVVPSPRITSSTPSGPVSPPVASLTFNFSEVMDTTSFSIAQDVFSFTGPAGNLIPFISGFTWVTNQQLRIDFASMSIPGSYSLVLNPTITNTIGAQLDNNQNGTAGEIPGDRYTASFSINAASAGNSFGYRFAAFPFDPTINLVPGGPEVNTLSFANNDDGTTTVSLNGNTFNYYGTNFTSVTVSTNGNIQFGGANTAFTNTDLTTSPNEAMFAGFWDDLHVGRDTVTDDVVLTKLQDVTGDGQPDLIVSWRNAHYFAQSPVTDNGITFQLVLQLNTGSNAGAMISNFVDLDSDNATSNTGGVSATVGIKKIGTTPATGDPLVAAFNGSNPTLVGSNKAVRFFKNLPPVANANGPYNVASGGTVPLSSAGTTDPEGDPLVFIWDLDGDGTFGETGAGALRGDETGASPIFNAAGLAGGAYQVALRVFDTSGDVGNATATVNVTAGAPAVSGVDIGNGNGSLQRSMVTRFVISFNQIITFAGAPTNAFTLFRTVGGVPTGSPITFTVSAIDNSTGFSRVTVTPTSSLDPLSSAQNPSLADGHYRLTVVASQVVVGGTPMVADSVTNFHRMFGDVTNGQGGPGDEHVDVADYGVFGLSYLKNLGDPGYQNYFDLNGDGHIDIFDYGQFGNRYLSTLP